MMTRQQVWENRDRILRNTRNLLERVKGKKTKFKEQTRKVMEESSQKGLGIDTEELKKVYWVIQNKYLPMLKKVGELQKDMEFLDSFQFGKWDIPQVEMNKTKTEGKKRRTLKEETIDRFRQEDVQVKNWKEGSSHPTSRVIGSPLQFTEYSLPYVLNNTGTQTFYDFVERKHPSDFVWGWKDRNQTVVMVMKNPSQRGLEINGVSKKKKPITEKETQEITRVDKFKPEPDDVKRETKYPSGWMGQYRGIHSHIDHYIWNQLGTEKSKEELLDRMEQKLKKGGGTWSDSYRVVEFEEEGKTVLINTWSFDSSD